MPDIEGISDRTPRTKNRIYDRALPVGGIQLFRIENSGEFPNQIISRIATGLNPDHDHSYLDFNDAPKELVNSIRGSYLSDVAYTDLSEKIKGNSVGKRFRIYALKGSMVIGAFSFTEYFDSPIGYGPGDFYHESYVLTEFRKTKDHKLASMTVFYLMFSSGLVKRAYSILRINPSSNSSGIDKFDAVNNPCSQGPFNPNSANYLSVGNVVDASNHLAILEMDGDGYKKMNLKPYFASFGHGQDAISSWLSEMDKIVEKMRI